MHRSAVPRSFLKFPPFLPSRGSGGDGDGGDDDNGNGEGGSGDGGDGDGGDANGGNDGKVPERSLAFGPCRSRFVHKAQQRRPCSMLDGGGGATDGGTCDGRTRGGRTRGGSRA